MRAERIAKKVAETDISCNESEILGAGQSENLVVRSATRAQLEDMLSADPGALKPWASISCGAC